MKLYLASASPRRRDLLEQLHIEFEVAKSTYEEHNEQATNPYELVEAQALGKALEAVIPITAGLETTKTAGATETTAATEPMDVAKATGTRTAAESQGYIVIGSDTIVAHKGHVLGKPADMAEAVQMLKELSGDTHEVVTGVALCRYDEQHQLVTKQVFHVVTKVVFYPLTDAEIESYVATGEPLDKAGAYGIQGQGAYLVERIEGSYTNVVGLPVEVVARYLQKL